MKIAKENIEKYGVDVSLIRNNGLNGIKLKENSVVVIAGMGTRNILKLLELSMPDEIILQSNDDLYLLR